MTKLTEQQALAVRSIDSNVLVSAGAGSGKTHVLVERYLEVLKHGGNIDELIAVTFTRKAAAEMRHRLKKRILEVAAEVPPEEQERWRKLKDEIDAARIGTIHALCEHILKLFPAQANVDPRFEILDDIDGARILEECIEESIFNLMAWEGLMGTEALMGMEGFGAGEIGAGVTGGSAAPDTDDSNFKISLALRLLYNYPIDDIKRWIAGAVKSALEYKSALKILPDLTISGLTKHFSEQLAKLHKQGLPKLLREYEQLAARHYLEQNSLDLKSKLEPHRQEKLGLIKELEGLAVQMVANANQKADSAAAGSLGADDTRLVEQAKQIVTALSQSIGSGAIGGTTEEAKAMRDNLRAVRDVARNYLESYPFVLNNSDQTSFCYTLGLIHLIEDTLSRYALKKREAHQLDFNDLISKTHELLTGNKPQARTHFQEKLKAILVDEFQDTNKVQSQLLTAMAGKNTRIFLIGDDKQSIYRFQGADVATFNWWRQFLGNKTLAKDVPANGSDNHSIQGPVLIGSSQVISLSTSFRSHPTLVNFVNGLFSNLLSEPSRWGAQFESLTAFREGEFDRERIEVIAYEWDGAPVDEQDSQNDFGGMQMQEKTRRDSQLRNKIDARAVAQWIVNKVNTQALIFDKEEGKERPIGYGDIAVLYQENKHFVVLEDALAQYKIPYVTIAGSGFLERQEVYDLENILRFLYRTQDSHALVGVLRSPLFGISDDVIHLLRSSRPEVSLWTVLRDKVGEHASLRRAVNILRRLIKKAATLSVADLIVEIIRETRWDVVLLSLPHGKQRSRNLYKLISLACDHNSLDIAGFLKTIASMREVKTKQSEAPLDSRGAVKLMTIHKSKGLEFPAVVLPLFNSKVERAKGKFLFSNYYGIAFDTSRGKDDEKPASHLCASAIESEMELAERKRLFYVATTRARDYLACFSDEDVNLDQASFSSWLYKSFEESETPPYVYEHLGLEQISASHETLLDAAEAVPSPAGEPADKIAVTNLLEAVPSVVEPLHINKDGFWRITPGESNTLEGALQIDARVLGTFFHALIERLSPAAVNKTDEFLSDVLATALPDIVHPQLVKAICAEARKLLDQFEGSDLQKLMIGAKHRLSEVPYELNTPKISEKRPDLLLQDKDNNWHVIDYKTDHFDQANIDKQIKHHAEQVSSYSRDIESLTGIKPKPWIYFAAYGKLSLVETSKETSLV